MLKEQVSTGLNLWLELRNKADMPELLGKIVQGRPKIYAALDALHCVHFARFAPTPDDAALQVITAFDGEFEAYVLDFVLVLADEFEMILSYVKDRSPSPVRDYPAQFLQFVRANNLGYRGRATLPLDLYSAYRQTTVIDIIEPPSGPLVLGAPVAAVPVARGDVQANVLRGVTARHGWHAGLRFKDAGQVRALLSQLLDGSAGGFRVSTDAMLDETPAQPWWLNLGFTFDGLLQLGIGDADKAAFKLAHRAFVLGPDDIDVAAAAGDIGDSRPGFWRLGGANPVHMVVSLWAGTAAERNQRGAELLGVCLAKGTEKVYLHDTDSIVVEATATRPEARKVHFGYVDGLSQPQLAIENSPPPANDGLPLAGVGEFLLGRGYPNAFGGMNSLGGLSVDLAENATFAALRIVEQDVFAFEELLDRASIETGKAREWIAARMMGRWRDGTPLIQKPDAAAVVNPALGRNEFDYRPTSSLPNAGSDAAGLQCPYGAHVRRSNPRSSLAAGKPHSRRLIRRGMAYGPAYQQDQQRDGKERGTVGFFLCADLERQYEFILKQWIQGDRAGPDVRGQQDPIVGAQAEVRPGNPVKGTFSIPIEGGKPLDIQVSRMTATIGSAYLFMPGIGGIQYLAAGAQAARSALASVTPADPQLAAFDPGDLGFRADPFPLYARFRAQQPAAFIPSTNSIWMFSHECVNAVAQDGERFLKRKAGDTGPVGLLQMDAPAHTTLRAEMEQILGTALTQVAPSIAAMVSSLYVAACPSQGQALDWMDRFAKPLARKVFNALFGLDEAFEGMLVDRAASALALKSPRDDPALDANVQMRLSRLSLEIARVPLLAEEFRPVPGGMFTRIMTMGRLHDARSNRDQWSSKALQVEHLANAATMVMTAVLPLQWFIGLASWRLLQDGGKQLQALIDDDRVGRTISNTDVVAELLRYDMSPPMSERHVRAYTEVLGIPLAKDQRLLLCWASASRDPVFGKNPDDIDFKRVIAPGLPRHGWAFGAEGPRNCLGRPLVYAVMEPVIEALRTARQPLTLEPGFEPEWGTPSQGAMFRSMLALPVRC